MDILKLLTNISEIADTNHEKAFTEIVNKDTNNIFYYISTMNLYYKYNK